MCEKCTDDRKDQPVLGMIIITGVKKAANAADLWDGGAILDPNDGKVYKVRLSPIDGGKSSMCAATSACRCSVRTAWNDLAARGDAERRRIPAKNHDQSIQRAPRRVLGAGVMGAQIAAHLVNTGQAGRAVRPAGQDGPKAASSPRPSRA